MAISPSGFEEYQKNVLNEKINEIVEILDKKIIERAQYELMDILRVVYWETSGEPLKKVCEGVCEQYLKNGWAWVGYKIEKKKTEVGEYIVKYVFLTQDNRNSWGGIPESKDYIMMDKIKER